MNYTFRILHLHLCHMLLKCSTNNFIKTGILPFIFKSVDDKVVNVRLKLVYMLCDLRMAISNDDIEHLAKFQRALHVLN